MWGRKLRALEVENAVLRADIKFLKDDIARLNRGVTYIADRFDKLTSILGYDWIEPKPGWVKK